MVSQQFENTDFVRKKGRKLLLCKKCPGEISSCVYVCKRQNAEWLLGRVFVYSGIFQELRLI